MPRMFWPTTTVCNNDCISEVSDELDIAITVSAKSGPTRVDTSHRGRRADAGIAIMVLWTGYMMSPNRTH